MIQMIILQVFKKEKPEKPIFETESLNRGVVCIIYGYLEQKKGPVSADGTLKVELSGKQKWIYRLFINQT